MRRIAMQVWNWLFAVNTANNLLEQGDAPAHRRPGVLTNEADLWRYAAALWILAPAAVVLIALGMRDVAWNVIWRFMMLTLATTSLSYCGSSIGIRWARIREIATLFNKISRDKNTVFVSDRDLKEMLRGEIISRRVACVKTLLGLVAWIAVVEHVAEVLDGSNGHPLIASLAAGFCAVLAWGKLNENLRMKPVAVEASGEEYDFHALPTDREAVAAEETTDTGLSG